jgi:hypothetical protein
MRTTVQFGPFTSSQDSRAVSCGPETPREPLTQSFCCPSQFSTTSEIREKARAGSARVREGRKSDRLRKTATNFTLAE